MPKMIKGTEFIVAKKTKNKKKNHFEDIQTTNDINEEESEAIFGNLYDGADEVLPASLAYENGQLPEDGSIQVAFDADDNAYYISYDHENEIFIEPYEKYELDASALYDAEGNPFDFFANYHVEGVEAAQEEESGEYWEQFVGVEGYGYYDENEEWVWTGYFDEDNKFIPNEEEEPAEVEALEEESEAAEEVVEQEPQEEVQAEEVEEQPESKQEGSGEYWEQFVGVEGYGYYDENNDWVWTGYFDENNNFVPDQYYDEYGQPVNEEEYAESVSEEQVPVSEEQVVEEPAEVEEVVEEPAVEQVPEEAQPEKVQEEVQAYEHVEEQQPEEAYVEKQPQEEMVVVPEKAEEYVQEQPEEATADAIDEYYDEITHVEDEVVEEEQIQTDNVISSDEINWSNYVGNEDYGYYDENNEWVWKGYFNEYGMFIPQQEDYTDSIPVDEQPVEQTADLAEQAEEEVVEEPTASDEIVQVEEEEVESEPVVPTVTDDLVALEQPFEFDTQQFVGNIDFGYYDESSEWIWTGHFDKDGKFFDFHGNLVYSPQEGVKPVEVPKPTDLTDQIPQNALVVAEPDVFSEDIIQQVDENQFDVGEELVVRGLLNPTSTPIQPQELNIKPVFEEEKLNLPVLANEVSLQPEEPKVDYSIRSDSDQLVTQTPVVLEDAVADDLISVDTKGFVPELSQPTFAPKAVSQDQFKLVQPVVSQPKFDQITHLADEIKMDVNVTSSDVDVQPIQINPSLEVASEPSKLDIFVKKPAVELKKIEFIEPVSEKIDLQIFEQQEVVTKQVLTIQKPTYTDETVSVSVNPIDETTSETDKIVQVTPTTSEVSDFDINKILNTKPVETITVELPKDEPKLVTGVHVSLLDVEAKPVEEIVEFDSPKPSVSEVVVEKEDKVTLVEEEPFFNKFIGNEQYGYYNNKNVWIWTGYFDDQNNFVSDKDSKTQKVDQLIEEFNKQEAIRKTEEVEAKKASEPFYNKYIGNKQFGYYNDKNVWIWNGYFDENDQFVPDQSSTKRLEKLIEDELQKQRIHELELELAQAQQAILESTKLKDQEVAKIKEEVVKAQQESIKAKEVATLRNFVPKASPLLNPAKEVENSMIVYQEDKLEVNDLRNELSKLKTQREEFDNFSKIRDLDVINLYNASTSHRGMDYVFSGFEKKEEQFVKKPLHFLEEVKADPVQVAKEETISNLDQLLKQNPHLLLAKKADKSVSPQASLTVLADQKEVELTQQAVRKQAEVIEAERVDVIKPLEQVQLNQSRSLLDDLTPKFEVKPSLIKDDVIQPKYNDDLEPIEQLQFKQERSLLDDYMPKFDDQGLLSKVEFKLPTVNKEYRPKVEPIDVIKPLEPVQINKKRSLLDDYLPPKLDAQPTFEKIELDLGLEKPLANSELYEELKAEFSTTTTPADSKDMIDQLLEETNDLITSSTQTRSTKIHSFSKSPLKTELEPILDTKFDDKFIELDENQGFDQLIVESDDELLTDVVQEDQPQLNLTEPVVQEQVSTNQIAVTNEEYKKDMAELKQFLEKRSEELFKQYFSKFEELTKLQMESFNQIKNELRSEMNEIRDEVRSNKLALTSEITEEIYPSAPKVSRNQRGVHGFSEPTSEFDFDNSLSLVNENNYDLYELLDRIINYEDVPLTSSNLFKAEEYQAKVKQSVHNIKLILKNSEAEATKNYNYILSTLKNEIALLQKDLPIISSQLNKLQHDLRAKQLNRGDYKFVQEQIQELRAEHANKNRAISFYNKKVSDLKSIYAQQIRKIKSDYKKISDLANKRKVSSDYIDQALHSFETARVSQPNIKRNYEQLYRNQLQQNVNANYGNFRRYDPLIENHGYEYFSNHQPREFFSELEGIDNDIFSSNDLIYSNRNTYLDENFRINDYELTSNFNDIDAIYGMDKLRLPPFEPSNLVNDMEFNSSFDIDFDTDF
ncbi:putative cytadherence-associated protein [Mycoplasmoides gallisepticum NC96_1596-4-2P]|uniref:Putative cytadherence-associated protein n=1 Tax=Mycoplasmoides gallisepticum WI01_2001.043-13-2P TaxID=1159201 RepID=J3VHD6_MYCGL|nr:EAGR box-containing protein [Mycoplasmoides gallisepticum]AFP76121.1 putative cytadherence-associated protein [Mycoplasmoides gallisepticum VA94_7994-1-7P]AFP76888.1 putative cytadherence-associated protein [Mycoplasmoides gallisepticum NC95_13295-2-2P]AFP77646.1 putative cytadherence-associated protein [Mycoplasmoides gallisepticum NC96_1596-4-2P]AFP79173.1 putative cytadherence-associated protein [Mycoplasmoides gallisepticum WI01_2001.043-13-2P]